MTRKLELKLELEHELSNHRTFAREYHLSDGQSLRTHTRTSPSLHRAWAALYSQLTTLSCPSSKVHGSGAKVYRLRNKGMQAQKQRLEGSIRSKGVQTLGQEQRHTGSGTNACGLRRDGLRAGERRCRGPGAMMACRPRSDSLRGLELCGPGNDGVRTQVMSACGFRTTCVQAQE